MEEKKTPQKNKTENKSYTHICMYDHIRNLSYTSYSLK